MIEFKEISASLNSISRRKKVYSVGVNDAWYKVSATIGGKHVLCPYYTAWHNMLARCYCNGNQSRNPTYIGCSVSDSWLIFSNFKAWLVDNYWSGEVIDKDLLVSGNKVYSCDTCLLVDSRINNLILSRESCRGLYPQGVTSFKNRFIARVKINGKDTHLGSFVSVHDAAQCYIKAKSAHIRTVASELEPALKAALIRKAEEMELRIKC